MDWLRSKLRAWLGILKIIAHVVEVEQRHDRSLVEAFAQMDRLQAQLTDFKEALKKRAAPAIARPVFTDYESAQVQALEEFKEK